MAVAAVALATPALTGALGVAGGFIVGTALTAGAIYVDSRYVIPGLLGRDRNTANQPKLQDVPTGSQGVGSPMITCYGRRMRVPAHLIFQSRKTREDQPSQKSGSQIVQRQVFIDCLLAVNGRYTSTLRRVIGNGRPIAWTDRNYVGLTTSGITGSPSTSGSARILTLNATSFIEVAFNTVFVVGDLVTLQGWTGSFDAANNPNGTVWRVESAVDHGFSPSSMVLKGIRGQPVTGSFVSLTAGNTFTPASIIRLDDTIDIFAQASQLLGSGDMTLVSTTEWTLAKRKFVIGDQVRVIGMLGIANVDTTLFRVNGWTDITPTVHTMKLTVVSGPGLQFPGPGPYFGFDSARAIMQMSTGQHGATGFLDPAYDVAGNFYKGAEDQGEHPILVAKKGTGNVSGYRGVAFIALSQLNVTQVGGQIPFSTEAIIDPDPIMTLKDGIPTICADRGFSLNEISTDGLTNRTLEGTWQRGAVALRTMLQPLLIAYQILTQESSGVIKFFSLENASVFQLRNDALFCDVGFKATGTQAPAKFAWDEETHERLPTSVNVRFIDPDNAYTEGFAPFTLRSSFAVTHVNVQDVNLTNVALRKREASDLAVKLLRDGWINARTVQTTLSSRWLHLLENDVLTFTDDESGRDYTVLIKELRITTRWLVEITAIVIDKEFAVVGSPIVDGPFNDPPLIPSLADLDFAVVDVPAITDEYVNLPGLVVAVCAKPGSAWAGATVFASITGEDWQNVLTIQRQGMIGFTTTIMNPTSAAEALGTSNVTVSATSVTIQFSNPNAVPLSSVTQAQAQQGANWFALVDTTNNVVEVFAAITVVNNGDGTYTLSNLLRGIRGTFGAAEMVDPVTGVTRSHAIGCRVVLLSNPGFTTSFVPLAGLSSYSAVRLKIVPAGGSLDDGYELDVPVSWRNVRPFPVRSLTKTIAASPYPVRFTVDHWTRRNLPVGSVGPYPLDEEYEGYQFDLYDPSGNQIRFSRTIQATPQSGSPTLRDKWVTFTAAEITAAGYTPGAATQFVIDVRQTSAYGLGPSNKRMI